MQKTQPATRDAARAKVVAHCQSLVDLGAAHWRAIGGSHVLLELATGDCFLFTDEGVRRLLQGSKVAQIFEERDIASAVEANKL